MPTPGPVLVLRREDFDKVPISRKFDAALVLIVETNGDIEVWKNFFGDFKGIVKAGSLFDLDSSWWKEHVVPDLSTKRQST